jgi:hypothetical protein
VINDDVQEDTMPNDDEYEGRTCEVDEDCTEPATQTVYAGRRLGDIDACDRHGEYVAEPGGR